ncbi:MAG: SPASM domain-containing protein [Paludibacter sp.]
MERRKEILLTHAIRQINISLHDAEENIVSEKWGDYMQSALDFATKAAPKTYICLRLWNTTNKSSADFNLFCLDKIASVFNLSHDLLNDRTNGNGIRLNEHIFLQRAPRFEWPDDKKLGTQTQKNCYALRDHIAILAAGEVVPCCLDADASMILGNIFSENLSDILQTNRAKEIKKGFEQRKVVEPICATCGFIID